MVFNKKVGSTDINRYRYKGAQDTQMMGSLSCRDEREKEGERREVDDIELIREMWSPIR